MKALFERWAGSLQLLFVVGVVGAAIFISAALEPDAPVARATAPSESVAVSVTAPTATSYRPTIALNGVVETRTLTNVIPQVSGRVIRVSPSFRPGAEIRSGDVLFTIDPSDYELAVERTLAEIEAARSELALLEAQAAAERRIWDRQFPDKEIPELIAKVPQIAAAEARIRSGEAARRAAELNLERTTVRAPYNARVLNTSLDVGQVVNTTAAVGSIFAIDSLEIAVPLSTADLERIGTIDDGEVRIYMDGMADQPVVGRVARVAASLDERTRLAKLYVSSDRTSALTLGQFVAVEIDGKPAPSAFRIPAAALTSRDQVWVVNDGKLEERTIEVLGRDGDAAVVGSFDIADGVVAIPPANVRSGLDVDIKGKTSLAASGSVSPVPAGGD